MMIRLISLFLSIVTAIFPFFNSLIPHRSIASSLRTVVIDDSGDDIILLDENGAAVDESIFYDEAETGESSDLPLSYDSREYGIITPSKSQGSTGC